MSFNQFWDLYQNTSQLRIMTCGSVDDGKSTFIGRLLYDTSQIYQDHLQKLICDSSKNDNTYEEIDFALLTDGLQAEREQGITIDVAYRYFNTSKRRFIIADCPGHVQYTQNMVSGASQASVAILFVDASQGITLQTKRHLFLTSLLGIKHIVLAINKMDLIGWKRSVYEEIKADFLNFVNRLKFSDINIIPISALYGDNVANASSNMSWYRGLCILDYLENVIVNDDQNLIDFRFGVQKIIKDKNNRRWLAGKVFSGVTRIGDSILVMSNKQEAIIDDIQYGGNKINQACAFSTPAILLDREIDISRGDIITPFQNQTHQSNSLEVMVFWCSKTKTEVNGQYLLKINHKTVGVTIDQIRYKMDINTLRKAGGDRIVTANDIARMHLLTHSEIYFDFYEHNKETGSFILIDRLSNETLGAGIILDKGEINTSSKPFPFKSSPKTFWFTGLSGAGKSTIANLLADRLSSLNMKTFVLDGDVVRTGLNKDLGYSLEDRQENIRRVSEMAKVLNLAGVWVIASFISPMEIVRKMAKEIIGEDRFVEIFVDASLEVCEKRDCKGLYKKARSGEIDEFTGIHQVYEKPLNPSIHLDCQNYTDAESFERLWKEILKLKQTENK
ncbi:MAG: adenylyl-sulfate kinase [bacterium]